MRKYPVYFTFLLIFTINGYSQFYEYGQDDSRLRWSFFDSPHYRLIYPEELDSIAFVIADRLEYFYPFQAAVLQHNARRMPVILHNESSFSNGLVSWAPKRLEIFTNPDPNGYPQDWLTQLVLHEGRHVFQVDKLNQGLTRMLSYVIGEQAVAAAIAYLPAWFLEGDAVDAETRFSYTGRGRLPSFEEENRAILLSRGAPYSYAKAMLGSYKNYIPDHYQTGYLIVDYARRNYGNEMWNDMIDRSARRPYSLDPAHFAFKKFGVGGKRKLYKEAMLDYLDRWRTEDSIRGKDNLFFWPHPYSRDYTSYRFPHFISDSSLFALKSGIDQIPEFILLDNQGKEKRLYRPGYLNSGRVSCSGEYVVWDEFIPDLRWSNLNYSELKLLDIGTGEVRKLGDKTRYYSPALSKNGKLIAAVEQLETYVFSLVILDNSGTVIHRIRVPENRFIQQPCWAEQDSAVILTMVKEDGEHLYSYNTESGLWDDLFCNGFEDISFPVVKGDTVFFGSTNSGIDDIYFLKLGTREPERLTRSKFGAAMPQISSDGKELLFSDYSSGGYTPAMKEIDFEDPHLREVIEKPALVTLREPDDAELKIIDGENDVPKGEYVPKKFNKTTHILNIHSWLPLYFDYLNPSLSLSPEALPVNPGITLLSQNLLSTAVSEFGYEYRAGYHYLHTGIVLKGRYPIFDIGIDYGGEPSVVEVDGQTPPVLSPDNLKIGLNSYIPFRLNTGRFISLIQPSLGWNYRSDYFFYEDPGVYKSGMHYINYQLYAMSYLRKGMRDIVPRFGGVFSGKILTTPFETEQLGVLAALSLSLYAPGILKHHSIKFSMAMQRQFYDKYLYSNQVVLSRGIDDLNAVALNRFSADYIFPIVYPDLSLSFLGYITRLRGAIWVDYLRGRNIIVPEISDERMDQATYLTTGMDLLMDCHPLRIAFPISIGVRFDYFRESRQFKSEVLFSIDLP